MVCKGIFATFLALFMVVGGSRHPSIFPPEVPGPEASICTSYSSLCHLAYNISQFVLAGPQGMSNVLLGQEDPYRVINSNQQICRCPAGRTCETNWFSTENSIMKNLEIGGMEMTVKMSYCNLRQASRICRQNEPAIILRGRGAFAFEIFAEFSCRCYRPLYAHRSWREGDYDYFEYSCGKRRCASNRHPTQQCTKITYRGSQYNLAHDYLCRCRRYEECNGNILPNENLTEVYQLCQARNFVQIDWDLQKRRRRKRNGRRNQKNKKN